MTDIEWEHAWGVFCGLWPKQSSDITDEIQASYRRVVSKFTGDQVVRELRGFSDTSKFMPKPSELKHRVQAKYGKQTRSFVFDRQAEVEASKAFKREVDQYINGMDDARWSDAYQSLVSNAVNVEKLVDYIGKPARENSWIRSWIYQRETGQRP